MRTRWYQVYSVDLLHEGDKSTFTVSCVCEQRKSRSHVMDEENITGTAKGDGEQDERCSVMRLRRIRQRDFGE
jgi:hypothetical protein